jgi:hypothetical protein
VRSAEQIAREAPDLIDDVQKGKLTIPAAKRKLAATKKSAAPGKSNRTPVDDRRISDDPRDAADLAYDSLRNDRLSLTSVVQALAAIIKISKPAMSALAKAHSDCADITDEFLESKLRELFSAGECTDHR